MTILGLELPVGYSHISTFDPTTAQMVLAAQNNYINALRDEYKLGLADIKEFGKEYGDFISPIEEDMQNYYNATTGAMNKLFSEAQARGIDLLRSPEGRSLVLQFIAARPYGLMAQWKQNAENAKTFLRVAASRKTQNPEFDRWWWKANYGIDDLSQWGLSDLTRGKVFDVSSIPTFQTLQDLVYDTVKAIEPGVLSESQVRSIQPGIKYDPSNKYTGISEDMIKDALLDYMPGLASDPNYAFHLYKAELKARADKQNRGDNTDLTDSDIYNQLMDDAVDASRWRIGQLDYDLDKRAELEIKYQQQKRLQELDHAFQVAKANLKSGNKGKNGNGGDTDAGALYDVQTTMFNYAFANLANQFGLYSSPGNYRNGNYFGEGKTILNLSDSSKKPALIKLENNANGVNAGVASIDVLNTYGVKQNEKGDIVVSPGSPILDVVVENDFPSNNAYNSHSKKKTSRDQSNKNVLNWVGSDDVSLKMSGGAEFGYIDGKYLMYYNATMVKLDENGKAKGRNDGVDVKRVKIPMSRVAGGLKTISEPHFGKPSAVKPFTNSNDVQHYNARPRLQGNNFLLTARTNSGLGFSSTHNAGLNYYE